MTNSLKVVADPGESPYKVAGCVPTMVQKLDPKGGLHGKQFVGKVSVPDAAAVFRY